GGGGLNLACFLLCGGARGRVLPRRCADGDGLRFFFVRGVWPGSGGAARGGALGFVRPSGPGVRGGGGSASPGARTRGPLVRSGAAVRSSSVPRVAARFAFAVGLDGFRAPGSFPG